MLIEHGAKVNDYGTGSETPLLLAVRHGVPDVARMLLERGADPNARDKVDEMWPPLIFAIIENDEQSAKLLLEHHADPNIAVGFVPSPTP
ncbi:ankyrin repeat domain-containing protein, partial [Salmonella enterica]|uniref:ankyrin repeat domain-containing protein n=1 Tax=Salmonella enterica TaxID=28901 RepID=UPI003CF5B658